MRHILDAIEARADSAAFAALKIPESYRAAEVLKSEQDTFKGVPSNQKDPRKTVHIQDVPVPEIAPDEVLIAVMASSINFNTCLLYTSPSPRDRQKSRMPSSA